MGPREMGELLLLPLPPPLLQQPPPPRIPRLGGVHTTNAAGRILNHKFMVRSLCPLAASSYRAGKRAWHYFNAARCFL